MIPGIVLAGGKSSRMGRPKALLPIGSSGDTFFDRVTHTLFDAVGSKQKMLKVFTREEGGFHHCQVDNMTIGTHAMWDWACDVLKPGC